MRDRSSDHHRRLGAALARRPLASNEIIHHRDEDKENNHPTNLEVQLRGAHSASHAGSRGLSRLRQSLRMTRRGQKLY